MFAWAQPPNEVTWSKHSGQSALAGEEGHGRGVLPHPAGSAALGRNRVIASQYQRADFGNSVNCAQIGPTRLPQLKVKVIFIYFRGPLRQSGPDQMSPGRAIAGSPYI